MRARSAQNGREVMQACYHASSRRARMAIGRSKYELIELSASRVQGDELDEDSGLESLRWVLLNVAPSAVEAAQLPLWA